MFGGMNIRLSTSRATALAAALATALTLAACEGSTAPGARATVQMSAPAVAGLSTTTAAGLSITGTNGTLLITDIKLVVDEFELKRVGVSSCNDSMPASSDDCEEFESNLFVADVPLGTGAVTVANDRIPPGTYDELEFEVKDLFVSLDDDDDVARAARIAEVLAQLRLTYANWPAGASMMVEGTFTPTGGAAQAFRVYFDAEVEVEATFATPLVIDDASQGVTIELRPDIWFKNLDGTVRNLALWNYATTSLLVEFEVEFEDGVEIEID
jgi:hypothetical protein